MHTTREAWLLEALGKLRPLLESAGLKLPKKVKVSCGFPGTGNRRKTAGECWVGDCEIFISPLQSNENGPKGVLETLLHEAIHACLPKGTGHRGPFKQAMKAVGLEGKAKCTIAGQELIDGLFKQIIKEIGPYPHRALVLGDGTGGDKQTTRLLKLACPACGLTVRITQKWLDEMEDNEAEPTCWLCGQETMEVG